VVPAATPPGPWRRSGPRPEPRLLLLFDIDGTLLQRASVEHALALRRAAARVHGLPSLDGEPVEAAGRTDGAILRDLLVAAGVPDAVVTVPELPHTATGKLMKAALRQRYGGYYLERGA